MKTSSNLKKVLILGSGMVAQPIVSYLLDKGFAITVASLDIERAKALLKNHPRGQAIDWTTDDTEVLNRMVSEHDLTVSLLPYIYHPLVAKCCVTHRKPLVTTSYVSPAMTALDSEARNAGVLLLNELGLDPGIDHMSAMRIIDHVHQKGGKIIDFYSLCGALPAPEAASNPLRYKFSWSPRGVIMASNNGAKSLRDGAIVEIPTSQLFKDIFSVNFKGVGELDVYPNRNSLDYRDIYQIHEAETVFRGTFRYKGWCQTLDALKTIGWLTSEKLTLSNASNLDITIKLSGVSNKKNCKLSVAEFLNTTQNSELMNALAWIGIFDDSPIEQTELVPFDLIADLMIPKMTLKRDERDMVVMMHVFCIETAEGKREVIRSQMLDFGNPEGDTSVARTVAIPAAIGVKLILDGVITETGVHRPVIPTIYNPILDELQALGIKLDEEYGLPDSENL